MDKYYTVLYYMNRIGFKSQRLLAKETNLSVGSVNSILKSLEQEQYIKKTGKELNGYHLTEKGQLYLEDALEDKRDEKLLLEDIQGTSKIRTAVILAAGRNLSFSKPVGLLSIADTTVIELLLHHLTQNGIEQFYIILGYQKEAFEEYFKNRSNVTLLYNERYKWTGTMASLSVIKDKVKEDFILVESNQIVEEVAISKVLAHPSSNCVLLTNPSDSQDEAFVELNEDGTIFRISKDIRQLNRIDAEILGISKISQSLFKKMLEYFISNQNPMLNYEYVMENIGRIYQIAGVLVDDMAWSVIENEALYYKANRLIYPRIKKREKLRTENKARETLRACMNLKDEEIEECYIGGGMTNSNFFVKFHGKSYILRIPGAGTDVMIDRKSEQQNGALAAAMGMNPPTIYFNPDTGIKVTECIEGAETLTGKTARLEMNIKETTKILRTLHSSTLKLYGSFDVQTEYEKYKMQIEESKGQYYEGFQAMDDFFYDLMGRLQQIGLEKKPCHNDLVAENFIKDVKGRMYLIDWEYSGYNDPMWDLAAHLIECEFTPVEEELFLQYYFGQEATREAKEKIMIYKICQDILWSAWTVLKEAKGEDFGSYGVDRLQRARSMRKEYNEKFKSSNKEF